MADKKIQIKNGGGDNLFPVTKLQCVDDFNSQVKFTGTQGNVSVSGMYAKATGVTINKYTPSGAVSKPTFTGTITLTTNTTSSGGIAIPTGVSNVGVSAPTATFVNNISTTTTSTNNIKYVESVSSTAVSATKGDYTPAGNVTSSFKGNAATIQVSGTPTGTVSLTGGTLPSLTVSNANATGRISYVSSVSHTAPTKTTSSIYQITGLGSTATRSSFTYCTMTVNGTVLSLSTATAYQITSVGSTPSRSAVSVVTNVSGGSMTSTTSYLNFNAGALRSGASFTGNAMTLSASYTPGGSVTSSFAGTKTNALVTGVSGGGATSTTKYLAKGTGNAVTSVAVSSQPTLSTTNYLHANVSGNVSQPTFTGTAATLTASITTSNATINSTGTFTPSGTVTKSK